MGNINEIVEKIGEKKAAIMNKYREDAYKLPTFEERCNSDYALQDLEWEFRRLVNTKKREVTNG